MCLNAIGEIVQAEWLRTGEIRKEVELDAFVVMPNHIHGILFLHGGVGGHGKHNVRANSRAPLPEPKLHRKPKSLGSLIAGFKSSVTVKINKQRGLPGHPVWQRNYHDYIVRDDNDLQRHRKYILENPLKWQLDEYWEK